MDKKYRHEYKFQVNEKELCLIASQLKNLMTIDPHVKERGSYRIRSVYFDDDRNTCYYENEAGTDPRSKYRIRIYDASDQRITLERKSKKNGMTLKESAQLTREQCQSLLQGKPFALHTPEAAQYPEVLKQFLVRMMMQRMLPKVIVEYERIPFIYKEGNVRITFDKNLSASKQIDRFLEKELFQCPILPAGQHILEVKYDEYIPSFLKNQLEIGTLQQTNFSKYYLCRRYAK